MADEYIHKHDALVALMDNDIDHIQAPNGKEAVQILSDIPAADVVPVKTLQAKISELKYQMDCKTPNIDYYTGYMSALYTVEDIIAKMDGGKNT